jgi:nicotinate-nucleotide adenylyltransferase
MQAPGDKVFANTEMLPMNPPQDTSSAALAISDRSDDQPSKFANAGTRIGIFGSAFDPPHRGHQDVLAQCLDRYAHIVLVPSFSHAFGKCMTPYDQRLQLLEAFRHSSGFAEQLSISTIEKQLVQPGAPVYSWDVMEALEREMKNQCGRDSLEIIVGPDNAAPETWSRWYRGEELRVRWPMFVARNNLPVRSTLIRQAIEEDLAVGSDWLAPEVLRAIEHMRLYGKSSDE